MNSFDRNLGKDFLRAVPATPGVYKVYDEHSKLIYIGKAKNLKRRLSQYKNAKRRKKHRKMRKIIQNARNITFDVCESEYSAELLETQLIQAFRPKWNVVGAFYFMYPMIGLKVESDVFHLCYTTEPQSLQDFTFFGAFRSREIAGEAFFALIQLFRFVGHPIGKKNARVNSVPKYSYVYGFRQIEKEWFQIWADFFKGHSREALEVLILTLVENAGARKKGEEIQKFLNQLVRFWKHEITPLTNVIQRTNHRNYPVAQMDRDVLFLKARYSNRASLASTNDLLEESKVAGRLDTPIQD